MLARISNDPVPEYYLHGVRLIGRSFLAYSVPEYYLHGVRLTGRSFLQFSVPEYYLHGVRLAGLSDRCRSNPGVNWKAVLPFQDQKPGRREDRHWDFTPEQRHKRI